MKTYLFMSSINGAQDFIKVNETKKLAIFGNAQASKVAMYGDITTTRKFINSKIKECKNRGFKVYDAGSDDYEVLHAVNREIEED